MNEKLLQMMIYFKNLSKDTILNDKVLIMCFYSDFTFYRDFGKSISEVTYINTSNGPSVKNKKTYFEIIKKKNYKNNLINEIFNNNEKKRINEIYIKFSILPYYYILYKYNKEFASLGTPLNSIIEEDKSHYMTTFLNREKEIRESKYKEYITK